MSYRTRLYVVWREWLRPLLVVAFVLCSFRSAVADWNDVPSGSMIPTILEGDRIFVDRRAYDLRVPFTEQRVTTYADPKRGDIVVFTSPVDGRLLVKRVAGVPGDEVRDIHGYRKVVPARHYFMAGDNEANSFDSRYWGCVPRERILGRATAVVFSLDHDHYWLPRWSRFLKTLS
jgi:signal peptidase I